MHGSGTAPRQPRAANDRFRRDEDAIRSHELIKITFALPVEDQIKVLAFAKSLSVKEGSKGLPKR